MTCPAILPEEFKELECFFDSWTAGSIHERVNLRAEAPMAAIRTFYDAALPRLAEMLSYLDEFAPEALPDQARRLYQLTLGLIQAAIAVELHGQPGVPNATYPSKIVQS